MSEFADSSLEAPAFEDILEFRSRCLEFAEQGSTPTPDALQTALTTPDGKKITVLKDTGWDTFSTWEVAVELMQLTHNDVGTRHRITCGYTLHKDSSMSKSVSFDIIARDDVEDEPYVIGHSRETVAEILDEHLLGLAGREGAITLLAKHLSGLAIESAMGFDKVSGTELVSVLEMLRAATVITPNHD